MSAETKERRRIEKARIAALPAIRCSCGAVWTGKATENNPVIEAHRLRASCDVTIDPVVGEFQIVSVNQEDKKVDETRALEQKDLQQVVCMLESLLRRMYGRDTSVMRKNDKGEFVQAFDFYDVKRQIERLQALASLHQKDE